ncbi:leucine-rich repeat domain-containing protein [Metamycoplasma hyosynoviae]|uniref:leucine-rich repeat domain-containing protein n=1 Tax=Metamycoplasma hyosynoviae TaxID=29559 RepID=UPI0004A13067|nr:leucine-rich repeat domain-containing protein [Metamycoplasma hyosynoviae]KDE44654.1 hypothetical protein NPL2_02640 [Metamycoplasma hyosynoviae]
MKQTKKILFSIGIISVFSTTPISMISCKFVSNAESNFELSSDKKTCYGLSDKLKKQKDKIWSLSLPSSVEKIADNAFEDLNKLSSIKMPKTLKEIGKYAFSNTALKKIYLPNSIESIKEGAFQGCEKLYYVWLGDNIREIQTDSFIDAPVKYIYIPNKRSAWFLLKEVSSSWTDIYIRGIDASHKALKALKEEIAEEEKEAKIYIPHRNIYGT